MIGTALLCITIKTIKSSNLFTKRWGYGLLGLLGGIGWWTSPMMIYYLITIPRFILLKREGFGDFKGGSWGSYYFLWELYLFSAIMRGVPINRPYHGRRIFVKKP